MKKRILLFTLVAGFAYVTLSSDSSGAGNGAGYDCTGAETGNGNPVGCSANNTCHGGVGSSTAGITVAIELDSAGVATTNYVAGMSYTIKITGTNTTTNNLPKFGFQVGAITGDVSAATPSNAGTFSSTGLPAGTQYTVGGSEFVVNVVEHSGARPATTGTGGSGTTYVESIPWVAPASGTGTVSLWAAVNAVNGDANATSADKWNTNHAVITERLANVSVATVANNISVKAFPNPVVNSLNLQMTDATEGNYTLAVYDLNGRSVANENIAVSGKSFATAVNTTSWIPGLYSVVLTKDGSSKVISVAKQ